jgi:antitoxin component YwqK of YwqJK toxin-antitoxin module
MSEEIYRTYYYSGAIKSKLYFLNSSYHRIDGPAFIGYYESGKILTETYYNYGKYHRLNGPAYIEYAESGEIQYERYYVNHIHVYGFRSKHIQKDKLFEYIHKYPDYIKEIEMLASHNHWLSEKELELLSCMDMFL